MDDKREDNWDHKSELKWETNAKPVREKRWFKQEIGAETNMVRSGGQVGDKRGK